MKRLRCRCRRLRRPHAITLSAWNVDLSWRELGKTLDSGSHRSDDQCWCVQVRLC